MALLTNIGIGQKIFSRTNTLAYFAVASVTKKKVLWHWHQGRLMMIWIDVTAAIRCQFDW
jgi:hypothetical protein